MAIDLKTLKKTEVSKNLKGKFVFLYGPPKIGKTTLASQFPSNIILGFEHGWNALNDVYAVDVPTWSDFKKYVKQLTGDPSLKEQFNTVTIDTISLAYDRCESYICDREGVDKIGDVSYGAGYKMVDKEFAQVLNQITLSGLGMVLIGHEKVRIDTDGQTSVKYITPDLSDRCAKIINRMVDLTAYIGTEKGIRYIYPRQVVLEEGSQRTEIFAGSHFSELNNKIDLSYDALVDAIVVAVSSDSTGKKVKLVDTPVVAPAPEKLDFNAIRTSIGMIAKKLMAYDEEHESQDGMNGYRKIVANYLGKNKLVKECTEDQVEHLSLILDDLNEFVKDFE